MPRIDSARPRERDPGGQPDHRFRAGDLARRDDVRAPHDHHVLPCERGLHVRHGHDAWLVRAGEHDDIKAIQRLWDDEPLRIAIGSAARHSRAVLREAVGRAGARSRTGRAEAMNWLQSSHGNLGTHVGNRDNNFNLIRFIAASLVLFSHSFALSIGNSSAEPLRSSLGTNFGQVAVDVFFLTEWVSCQPPACSRAACSVRNVHEGPMPAHIYPGVGRRGFCGDGGGRLALHVVAAPRVLHVWRHLALYWPKNATMIAGGAHTLPGAFENTPWRHLVNASLWTLPLRTRHVLHAWRVLDRAAMFPRRRRAHARAQFKSSLPASRS